MNEKLYFSNIPIVVVASVLLLLLLLLLEYSYCVYVSWSYRLSLSFPFILSLLDMGAFEQKNAEKKRKKSNGLCSFRFVLLLLLLHLRMCSGNAHTYTTPYRNMLVCVYMCIRQRLYFSVFRWFNYDICIGSKRFFFASLCSMCFSAFV